MRTHKNIKIESAASKDKTRPAIGEPYLDIDSNGGRLVATDGRILAVVPVEITSEDSPGYVSGAVLKSARKASGKSGAVNVDLPAESANLIDGTVMPRAADAKGETFPDWRRVLPKTPDKVFSVSLDVDLLSRLAEAMGAGAVTLTFDASDLESGKCTTPIQVAPKSTDKVKVENYDAYGVIMPMR